MKLELPEQIHRENWLRYLQGSGEPTPQMVQQMDEAEKMLLAQAHPRAIYRVLGREDVATEGFAITKHLEGCDRVAVLAMTIGGEADALIRRYEVSNMAMALIIDAGASALTEQMADEAERVMIEEIKAKRDAQADAVQTAAGTAVKPLYFTPRFSPGYGDYPIQYQREILAYVDAARKIGITLTPSNMMMPSKSITALVGLADHPVTGRLATCGECVLREKCTLRKEGQHC
ncbi:MAG: methionine synthase [Firmicutes bacterium]|nr:methionine synthase [Bacillota bacterium]